ncbi:MAG: hypothetical protein KDD50_13580 [Bdellovibrionales bacterium]|nr:hypothetical protein [Bdellovibrionales bacterium]
MLWKVEQLVNELKQNEKAGIIYQWSVEIKSQKKEEFYYIQSQHRDFELDQMRSVDMHNIYVTLFSLKENSKVGRHRQEFFNFQELESQLKLALEKCDISEEEKWNFSKSMDSEPKEVLTSYASINDNITQTAQGLSQNMTKAIEETQQGVFNSAELFVIAEKNRRLLSTGLDYETRRSKIYQEVCFSFQDDEKSEEFLLTEWGCHPEQIDIKSLCQKSSHYAKMSLNTEKPQSGNYSVLIDSEVLIHLFNDLFSQLNAERKYLKLPFLQTEDEVIPNFEGENFQVWVDPEKEYGFLTTSYNSSGSLQKKIKLIDHNKVKNNLVGTQYSQYLEWPETTEVGNVVVDAQGFKKDELLKKNKETLEILQFSGLFTNDNDLTFSSEIRLAKLHNRESGEIKYIKGGSLSGSFRQNFRKVMWSEEKVARNQLDYMHGLSYFGPEFALLNDVSVVS